VEHHDWLSQLAAQSARAERDPSVLVDPRCRLEQDRFGFDHVGIGDRLGGSKVVEGEVRWLQMTAVCEGSVGERNLGTFIMMLDV
jgi:hypothetical protein